MSAGRKKWSSKDFELIEAEASDNSDGGVCELTPDDDELNSFINDDPLTPDDPDLYREVDNAEGSDSLEYPDNTGPGSHGGEGRVSVRRRDVNSGRPIFTNPGRRPRSSTPTAARRSSSNFFRPPRDERPTAEKSRAARRLIPADQAHQLLDQSHQLLDQLQSPSPPEQEYVSARPLGDMMARYYNQGSLSQDDLTYLGKSPQKLCMRTLSEVQQLLAVVFRKDDFYKIADSMSSKTFDCLKLIHAVLLDRPENKNINRVDCGDYSSMAGALGRLQLYIKGHSDLQQAWASHTHLDKSKFAGIMTTIENPNGQHVLIDCQGTKLALAYDAYNLFWKGGAFIYDTNRERIVMLIRVFQDRTDKRDGFLRMAKGLDGEATNLLSESSVDTANLNALTTKAMFTNQAWNSMFKDANGTKRVIETLQHLLHGEPLVPAEHVVRLDTSKGVYWQLSCGVSCCVSSDSRKPTRLLDAKTVQCGGYRTRPLAPFPEMNKRAGNLKFMKSLVEQFEEVLQQSDFKREKTIQGIGRRRARARANLEELTTGFAPLTTRLFRDQEFGFIDLFFFIWAFGVHPHTKHDQKQLVVCLVGESGCGKSSILAALLQLIPNSGKMFQQQTNGVFEQKDLGISGNGRRPKVLIGFDEGKNNIECVTNIASGVTIASEGKNGSHTERTKHVEGTNCPNKNGHAAMCLCTNLKQPRNLFAGCSDSAIAQMRRYMIMDFPQAISAPDRTNLHNIYRAECQLLLILFTILTQRLFGEGEKAKWNIRGDVHQFFRGPLSMTSMKVKSLLRDTKLTVVVFAALFSLFLKGQDVEREPIAGVRYSKGSSWDEIFNFHDATGACVVPGPLRLARDGNGAYKSRWTLDELVAEIHQFIRESNEGLGVHSTIKSKNRGEVGASLRVALKQMGFKMIRSKRSREGKSGLERWACFRRREPLHEFTQGIIGEPDFIRAKLAIRQRFRHQASDTRHPAMQFLVPTDVQPILGLGSNPDLHRAVQLPPQDFINAAHEYFGDDSDEMKEIYEDQLEHFQYNNDLVTDDARDAVRHLFSPGIYHGDVPGPDYVHHSWSSDSDDDDISSRL